MCEYREICKQYTDDCISDGYWARCYIYRTFESILDRQVFISKIKKQIFRDEHPTYKTDKE